MESAVRENIYFARFENAETSELPVELVADQAYANDWPVKYSANPLRQTPLRRPLNVVRGISVSSTISARTVVFTRSAKVLILVASSFTVSKQS